MSDEDKKKNPETDDSQFDDDLESLSDEEKSAFTKIMAEIASAEGKPAAKPGEPTHVGTVNESAPKASTYASDDTPPDDASARSKDSHRKGSEENDDELSDEQQAALDKIMAEINERKEAPAPPAAEAANTADDAARELPDDQQDALDKIMTEINSSGQSADTEAQKHLKQPPAQSPTNEKEADPQEQTVPYTMLKEVTVSANAASSAKSKQISSGAWSRRIRKALQLSVVISVVIALIGLGAWAYRFFDSGRSLNVPEIADAPEALPMTKPEQAAAPNDDSDSDPLEQAHPASEPQIPRDSPFASIRHDLENAREQLAAKKKELQDLKTYYQKGILEEQSKITAKAASAKLTDYQAAIKNSQVELSLRSIQRRTTYLVKLDTPLNQINAALEELLYWQRCTQLFELLSNGISGLPVSEFKQEVERITQQHLEKSQKLSIETIKVPKPELAAIWKELTNKKVSGRAAATQKTRLSKKDLAIGKEICSGNFEHLYLLTSITDEAAACLIRWSGKDLYLNELTHLSPAAARSLAQWPGERLSLNGIRSLSAESAKYLSQWPGKWLSLNGLTRLSNEATTYLAQWQGEQLEMVGLNSIIRWENYVTRLYLSEDLRRKLEMQ